VCAQALTRELAERLAALPLACLTREYPNKLDHVMHGPADVASPRALHPAFYGCFDWHSAVHGHWTLARLVNVAGQIAGVAALFDATLTAANLEIETAYVKREPGFERPYGWAWLLALAGELADTRWAAAIAPLADAIAARFTAYLPRLRYPVRAGTHANTAFALGLVFDARADLAGVIRERAIGYYGEDVAALAVEPSGEDFLSPALVEADLMRRVLPPAQFATWFAKFLPAVELRPAIVGDRTDGKLAHLDGLNLSRAWCLHALAAALPDRADLAEAAECHATAGLANVATGNYAGEHWLATFATYLVTSAAERRADTA
jgi:hypothetical protein